MKTLSRRRLLSTASMIPLAVGLAACAGGLPAPVSSGVGDTLSKIVTVAVSIAQGLQDLMAGVPALSSLLGSSTFAKVQSWISDITGAASALGSASSLSSASSFVSTLVSAATNILGVVGVALPPPFDLILPAISVLLPTIMNLVGMVMPSTAAHARYLARAATMSPASALATIQAVHAQRAR